MRDTYPNRAPSENTGLPGSGAANAEREAEPKKFKIN